MAEPVRIVITLEGGMITAICTMGVPVQALVIDYDVDDMDPTELVDIEQSDGSLEEAHVVQWEAEPLQLPVTALEEFWEEKPQEPA